MPLMALKVTLNAQITCFLLGEANAMYNESCLSVGDTIYWALTSMTYGGAVESPNHTRGQARPLSLRSSGPHHTRG